MRLIDLAVQQQRMPVDLSSRAYRAPSMPMRSIPSVPSRHPDLGLTEQEQVVAPVRDAVAVR